MSQLRAFALAIVSAVVLAGCTLELPPAVSGTAQPHGTLDPLPIVQLSPVQLEAVSSWFSQHSSGWGISVASYIPVFEVTLTLSNGKTAYVNIMQTQVVVNYDKSQYVQSFPKSDIESLGRLVGQYGG
jgi:hypothetical protein